MANTPNMSLPLDSPGVATGPGWASDIETTKLAIDAHTHQSGQGVPVPTAGLNINASLPMGGFGLTNAGTLGLASQATTSSGTANLFFNSGGNIYWNNSSGVPIQITSGSSLNAASIGGITGLGGTTGAWTYSAALTTFIGTADTNKSAAVDAGALTIRETNVASAKGITVKSPSALAADYNLTLPAATIPSGIFAMSNSGVFYANARSQSFQVTNAGSNIGLSNNTKVVCGGIAGGDNNPSASFRIPANTPRDGSTFHMRFWGNNGGGNIGVATVKLLAGTTGTTSDAAIVTYETMLGGTTAVGFYVDMWGTFNSSNSINTIMVVNGSGLSRVPFTSQQTSSAVTVGGAFLLSASLTQAGGAAAINIQGGVAEFFP